MESNGKQPQQQVNYESSNTFKPFGALTSNNMSPLSSNQMDSILNSNSLALMRNNHSNLNQYMNKTDMDSNRRLLLTNGNQMPMYSNGSNNYQQRALSSSSSSSIQQTDTLKDNQEM